MRHPHTLSDELRKITLKGRTAAGHINHQKRQEAGRRGKTQHSMANRTLVTDNRARTYLANERTFLAWLRTGITLIALGLAALEFLARTESSFGVSKELLGFGLIAGGTIIVLVEWYRYRKRDHQIEEGDLHGSVTAVTAAAALVIIIGVLSLVFIAGVGAL